MMPARADVSGSLWTPKPTSCKHPQPLSEVTPGASQAPPVPPSGSGAGQVLDMRRPGVKLGVQMATSSVPWGDMVK
jgi:hypothetical protein